MRLRGGLGGLPRWARVALPVLALALVLAVVVLVQGDRDPEVTAADDPTSTTEDSTTTTEATTTTTEATTTTAAPTTTVPPTTAPPTTAPPPTAPPTTVPAAPTEFRATVRGHDQGPDFYGIFYGTTYGGSGGFTVTAKCRPGTVTVTVIEDGWGTPPTGNTAYPTRVWIYADEKELAYNRDVGDGTVISGPVSAKVLIRTSGPSEHDMRVKYDCRG